MQSQTTGLSANKGAARNPSDQPASRNVTMSATATKQQVTRQDQLAAMLFRRKGASIAQIIKAFGWQPHSARAAISGLRKRGIPVESSVENGKRIYKATDPKAAT